MDQLAALTGIPVLGVVPTFWRPRIGEEDTVPTNRFGQWSQSGDLLRIGVVHYPFRSNFTDFDPSFTNRGRGALRDGPCPAGHVSRHLPARHQADHG
jgi:cobyric acid synthase